MYTISFLHCFTLYQTQPKNCYKEIIFNVYLVQYSKTCLKQPLSKRPKIDFQHQLSLYAGQKYCRMLQGEHSAILPTFTKLPFGIKIFVLSIFEWLFYTGFTVLLNLANFFYQRWVNLQINLVSFFFFFQIPFSRNKYTLPHSFSKFYTIQINTVFTHLKL